MSLIKTVEFGVLGDERGSLISLEQHRSVPFEIKRVYYIFGTSRGVARGFHAHYKLVQLAVCIKGSCCILMDDGHNKETIVLDKPSQGLIIDAMQWHEMRDFSDDCVLMVLANGYYDEEDYIRKYTDFLKESNHDS